jgi:hypothetical protein
MSGIVLAGLAVLAMGFFGWVISGPLARWASSSHAYLMPGADHETSRRRQTIWIRVTATGLMLFGGGLMVYGLLGGG